MDSQSQEKNTRDQIEDDLNKAIASQLEQDVPQHLAIFRVLILHTLNHCGSQLDKKSNNSEEDINACAQLFHLIISKPESMQWVEYITHITPYIQLKIDRIFYEYLATNSIHDYESSSEESDT